MTCFEKENAWTKFLSGKKKIQRIVDLRNRNSVCMFLIAKIIDFVKSSSAKLKDHRDILTIL